MDILISRSLVSALRDQLIDEDRTFSFGRRRGRQRFVARLTALLNGQSTRMPFDDLLEAARRQWADDGRIRFAERPLQRIDRDGLWINGWIWAGTVADAHERSNAVRFLAALASLPPLARSVFKLHCKDDLDFPAIAARLDIPVETVRAELAAALHDLDKSLDDAPNKPIA